MSPGLAFSHRPGFTLGLELLVQLIPRLNLCLSLPLGLGSRFGFRLKLTLQLRDSRGKRLDLLHSTGFGSLDCLGGFGLDSGSLLSLGSESLLNPGSGFRFLLGALLSLQSAHPFRFGLRFCSRSRFSLRLNLLLCLGPEFEFGLQLLFQFGFRLSLCVNRRLSPPSRLALLCQFLRRPSQ